MKTTKQGRLFTAKLQHLVNGFIELLHQVPQPPDNVVRQEFIDRDRKWRVFCMTHHLNLSSAELFKTTIRQVWENHKTPLKT